jgi:cytochrome P450
MEGVVLETLRLHPSVPKDVKEAVADDVLPDGTRIKKGDVCALKLLLDIDSPR